MDILPFILINYFLSALMWTLVGRIALALLIGKHQNNWIYLAFCKLTNWYLQLVVRLSLGFFQGAFLPLWGLFLLMVLRLVVYAVFYSYGLTPKAPG